MKIVRVDNFGREYKSDVFVCENVNNVYGTAIVEFLNNRYSGEYSDDFFELVDDNYELYEFKP